MGAHERSHPSRRPGAMACPAVRHADQRLPAFSVSASGSRPFPADSGELSFRSRGRRFRSGRQRLVLDNSRWRAAPPSGCQSVPPIPCRPTPSAQPPDARCHHRWGSPDDRPAGGHPPHRSSRPLAGPVQPSLGPLRLGSPPNLRIKSELLRRSTRSTCTNVSESARMHACTRRRPVLVPRAVPRFYDKLAVAIAERNRARCGLPSRPRSPLVAAVCRQEVKFRRIGLGPRGGRPPAVTRFRLRWALAPPPVGAADDAWSWGVRPS